MVSWRSAGLRTLPPALRGSGSVRIATNCGALKSAMRLYGVAFRRTHDPEQLARQLIDAGQPAPVEESDLSRLTPYAVEYRYDDDAPELLSGAQASAIVESVRAWAGHCSQVEG